VRELEPRIDAQLGSLRADIKQVGGWVELCVCGRHIE
jgi:hypothetical protein